MGSSFLLLALNRVWPDDPLTSRLAVTLLDARSRGDQPRFRLDGTWPAWGSWGNTHDDAMALLAPSEHMKSRGRGEHQVGLEVWADAALLARSTLDPAASSSAARQLPTTPIGDQAEQLFARQSGAGSVRYSMVEQHERDFASGEGEGRGGLTIARQFPAGSKTLHAGGQTTLWVEINNEEAIKNWMVVEIPLPGGVETRRSWGLRPTKRTPMYSTTRNFVSAMSNEVVTTCAYSLTSSPQAAHGSASSFVAEAWVTTPSPARPSAACTRPMLGPSAHRIVSKSVPQPWQFGNLSSWSSGLRWASMT